MIVGADVRGAAAVQHLHSTIGAGAELLGLLDDDSFKHGKLFHGYPVLGSLDNLGAIMARTPFDEIVIAQETLSTTQLAALESFTVSHRVTLRRFWLGVTDMSAPTISDQQLDDCRIRRSREFGLVSLFREISSNSPVTVRCRTLLRMDRPWWDPQGQAYQHPAAAVS